MTDEARKAEWHQRRLDFLTYLERFKELQQELRETSDPAERGAIIDCMSAVAGQAKLLLHRNILQTPRFEPVREPDRKVIEFRRAS
jgi:hypothetical protein